MSGGRLGDQHAGRQVRRGIDRRRAPHDLIDQQTRGGEGRGDPEALVARGDPEARRQSDALREEVRVGSDGAERDRRLLDRLVDIRSANADDPDGTATDAAYADAFREAYKDLVNMFFKLTGE